MGKRAVGRLTYYLGVLFTIILFFVTLLASRASSFHPESSFLISFLGLAYPLLIGVNLVVMIIWVIRFRFWFLIPLVAIACGFGYFRTMYYPPFLRKSNEQGNVRIATYNASAFNNPVTDLDAKDLAVFMEMEKVDILCIQEFAGSHSVNDSMLLSAFTHWPYQYVPQVDNKLYNRPVIFSRYPLSSPHLVSFTDTKNCAIYCDVEIRENKYRIFNNHLQSMERTQIKVKNGVPSLEREEYYFRKRMEALYRNFCKRAAQADRMQSLVKESPYPVLLCGDFNDTPDSYVYKTMRGGLKDGFLTTGSGNAATYRYAKRMFRIDYIFYSEHLKPTRYFKSDFGESDHYSVIMELRL